MLLLVMGRQHNVFHAVQAKRAVSTFSSLNSDRCNVFEGDITHTRHFSRQDCRFVSNTNPTHSNMLTILTIHQDGGWFAKPKAVFSSLFQSEESSTKDNSKSDPSGFGYPPHQQPAYPSSNGLLSFSFHSFKALLPWLSGYYQSNGYGPQAGYPSQPGFEQQPRPHVMPTPINTQFSQGTCFFRL